MHFAASALALLAAPAFALHVGGVRPAAHNVQLEVGNQPENLVLWGREAGTRARRFERRTLQPNPELKEMAVLTEGPKKPAGPSVMRADLRSKSASYSSSRMSEPKLSNVTPAVNRDGQGYPVYRAKRFEPPRTPTYWKPANFKDQKIEPRYWSEFYRDLRHKLLLFKASPEYAGRQLERRMAPALLVPKKQQPLMGEMAGVTEQKPVVGTVQPTSTSGSPKTADLGSKPERKSVENLYSWLYGDPNITGPTSVYVQEARRERLEGKPKVERRMSHPESKKTELPMTEEMAGLIKEPKVAVGEPSGQSLLTPGLPKLRQLRRLGSKSSSSFNRESPDRVARLKGSAAGSSRVRKRPDTPPTTPVSWKGADSDSESERRFHRELHGQLKLTKSRLHDGSQADEHPLRPPPSPASWEGPDSDSESERSFNRKLNNELRVEYEAQEQKEKKHKHQRRGVTVIKNKKSRNRQKTGLKAPKPEPQHDQLVEVNPKKKSRMRYNSVTQASFVPHPMLYYVAHNAARTDPNPLELNHPERFYPHYQAVGNHIEELAGMQPGPMRKRSISIEPNRQVAEPKKDKKSRTRVKIGLKAASPEPKDHPHERINPKKANRKEDPTRTWSGYLPPAMYFYAARDAVRPAGSLGVPQSHSGWFNPQLKGVNVGAKFQQIEHIVPAKLRVRDTPTIVRRGRKVPGAKKSRTRAKKGLKWPQPEPKDYQHERVIPWKVKLDKSRAHAIPVPHPDYPYAAQYQRAPGAPLPQPDLRLQEWEHGDGYCAYSRLVGCQGFVELPVQAALPAP